MDTVTSRNADLRSSRCSNRALEGEEAELLARNHLCSLDGVSLAERLPIPPDHTHFFPTEASVFDDHAEERVLVLLVIGGKGFLVKQHAVSSAHVFANSGSFFLMVAIRLDSRCMRSSLVIVL